MELEATGRNVYLLQTDNQRMAEALRAAHEHLKIIGAKGFADTTITLTKIEKALKGSVTQPKGN